MPTKEEIKIKLQTMIKNSGIKKNSKYASCLEFGLLQGIAMSVKEDEFPPYYTILMMTGRSILDEI
jgi:hypothetical protein